MKTYVVTAAGGNATAVNVCDFEISERWYQTIGQKQLQNLADYGVEQVGFFIKSSNKFQMSGGEFCGNGTRAAGLVCSIETGINTNSFYTSGFEDLVTVSCGAGQSTDWYVTGQFPKLSLESKKVASARYGYVDVVDMGGIVHIIIYAEMPTDYLVIHNEICRELGMLKRLAVGVNWVSNINATIKRLDPVVWVSGINSYFYETACGSGSMAAAQVCKVENIQQPSGEVMTVVISNQEVRLGSSMKVIYEN